MVHWPVRYDDFFLDTKYGEVHVIASGAVDAPPMFMIHASGVSSWSWKDNIAMLSRSYRTYAIDLIGDAGLSEYTTRANVMTSGRDQADLYNAIAEALNVNRAVVIGASEGGYIATNFELHYPRRVQKLILLAPMGYSGTILTQVRIIIAYLFPFDWIKKKTFSWAFSENQRLQEEYKEWFPLLMTGIIPAKVPPIPFSSEDRESIKVPTLFVFGTGDNLVGNPEVAKDRVQDVPDVQVRIVEAGHLVAGELPRKINQLILEFLESE